MTVSTCEIAGSPTGGHDGSGPYRKRSVIVDWDDIETYEAELLPPSVSIGQGFGGAAGQLFPGSSVFRVASYTWGPHFGQNDRTDQEDTAGNLKYEKALFDIDYRVPKSETGQNPESQELDPVQLLEHSFESDGEFLTLPTTKLYWRNSGSALSEDANAGILIPVTRHVVTWPRAVDPNWEALEAQKGTINNAAFIFRGYRYPAQTLLYLGYSGGQEVMSDGARAWKLTLKFSVRYLPKPHFVVSDVIDNFNEDSQAYAGWNEQYDESLHWWDTVEVGSAGSAKRQYRTSTFSNLFAGGT